MTDDELADLKRDNAERKARRLAGQEPELWQLPEREAVRAAPSINVAVIFDISAPKQRNSTNMWKSSLAWSLRQSARRPVRMNVSCESQSFVVLMNFGWR